MFDAHVTCIILRQLCMRSHDVRRDTGLRQGVIARHLPLLPPQSSWERKKTFCIGGINSRHLDAAQNRDFGGSINLKTDQSEPDWTQTPFFAKKFKFCFVRRELIQTFEGYTGFYHLESPLYIWFPCYRAPYLRPETLCLLADSDEKNTPRNRKYFLNFLLII